METVFCSITSCYIHFVSGVTELASFCSVITLPKSIFAHGWWLMEDEKMSKSIGNIIKPLELAEKYFISSKDYIPNSLYFLGCIYLIQEVSKNFNKIIFAGSLGKIFRQKINNFSKKKNYIITNKKIVGDMQLRLNQINNRPKIGISWFSKNKRIGGGKSIKLQELLPILELKEVSYVNMQYDNRREEIKEFKEQTGIEIIELDDIDKFNDFESLAALIESLDLFITVSNTTAHLSGAIGKETWVMAPKNDSLLFYWNTGKTKTPWYPKVKIYPKYVAS